MSDGGRDARDRARLRLLTGAQLAAAIVITTLFTFPFAPGRAGPERASAAAPQRAELAKLRTRTSTTYRNPNGTLTTSLSSGSVNYRHPSRGWQPIRSDFVPAGRGGFAWRNEANSFQTLFKSELDSGYLQVRFGGAGFGFSLRDAITDATARVRDGRLSYRDAVDGVDLRYGLFADGLKETLVLPDAEAPTRYRFLMTPPARPRTRAERQADGSWAFYLGARATPLFQLEAPTAIDAAGVRGGSPRLRVTRTGARFAIDLTIDRQWLRSSKRRFPVALDPTITLQPSSQDASFNDACPTCTPYLDTKLYIGTTATERWRSAVQFNLGDVPAGANVTNARLKLYYSGNCVPTADGICRPLSARLNAHRMTAGWSTTSTSGALQFDPTPVAGLDFSTIADADVQWLAWDVTGTTKNWLAGTQTNYGLLIKRETEPLGASGPAPLSRRYTTEASLQPKLEVTYSGDGVELVAPDTLHANGAELRWARYAGPSGAPFAKYEVHRSKTAKFVPTASTLLATIGDPNVTSFRDTTAAPSKVFYYKVVANSSASNERKVTLPGNGNSNKTLQPEPLDGRATYVDNAGAKCTNHGGESDLWLSSDLAAVRRVLLHFDLRDIPTNATISGARLSVWRPFHAGVNAWVDAHRVTSAWEEGTGSEACTGNGATWLETEGGVGWNADGVDYAPTPVKSLNSNNGASWNNFFIETLARQWVSGEVPNLGVLLKLQDETAVDKKKFRYYGDDFSVAPTLRPKLYVTYTDGSRAEGPTVSVAAPAGGEQVGGSAVKVSAAASDDRRVDRVDFYLDGATTAFASDTMAPFEATWNSTGAANGGHTLTAKATDDAGNETTSAPAAVTVHNSALPTTSVTAPTATTVTGTTTVSASAADDLGVTKVEFYSDDLLIGEDATAPYSVAWNTLDQSNPAYDGSHTLTAKAYDTGGQVTTSAAKSVTATNTTGTKYKATFASTEFPQAVIYDPAAGTQEKYGLDVTVTNASTVGWSASDVVLRYRWESPDTPAVFTTGPDVSLGSTLNAGQSRTLRVMADPPALPEGVNKAQYKLRVDLYSKTNLAWFADKGNKPLENPVIVNKALVRGALGFEPYYQFVGEELGAGMRHEVNVANGNSLVRWTPFTAPGRGLDTVLTLTHNALEKKCECPAGNNFSLGISSLTRFGNPIDVHPNKADEIAGRSNKYIEFTDADGTTHRFTSNDGITYQEPDGVHLFLRRHSTTDLTRKWALTTPDRVTYFYDSEGYPTFVEDRNGNKLTYTVVATPSGEDPGGPKKRITKVTDAGGRDFTITYYSKADAKKAHVRGKIKRITDHSGSPLDFEYYDDGNLRKLIQRGGTKADGSFLADRSFVFTYTTSSGDGPAIPLAVNRVDPDTKTSNQSTRLYSVRDPRGSETLFSYLGPGHGEDRWKLASRTDRAGSVTNYGYDIVNRVTTVTLPLSRVWKYGYDVEGKVTSITNPLNQTTTQAWSGDRMLTKVTEPTGKYVEFAYNANGLKTAEWDQLRNQTAYEYDNVAVKNADGTTTDVAANWKVGRTIPHVSQLVKETNPKGTATVTPTNDFQWTFAYDAKGNQTGATDPLGHTTAFAYNADGTLASATDPNNHTTRFGPYDANGLPTTVTNALGHTAQASYDADGHVTWVQDALHAADTGVNPREYRTYVDYDSFGRPGRQSSPKSTSGESGTLIWTSVVWDENDNVVTTFAPAYFAAGGPQTKTTYDAMDRETQITGPDTSVDPAGTRTQFAWDPAGRVVRETSPKGVLTTATDKDFASFYSYDALDRAVKETRHAVDAAGAVMATRNTHSCYDAAGELRWLVSARAGLDAVDCAASTPPGYTTRYAYDAAHRLTTETDAQGNSVSFTYDANGNPETATDKNGVTDRNTYNQRDELTQVVEPLQTGTSPRNLTTKYEYDAVGNLKREISPRAYDSSTDKTVFTEYVTTHQYDAVDQLVRTDLPTSSARPQAQYVHRTYDPNGNVIWTSAPVTTPDPTLVAPERKFILERFDPGWIKTSKVPGLPKVYYDYGANGMIATRTPTTTSGELDTGRKMRWTYSPDDLVLTVTDRGGQSTSYTYDANGNVGTAAESSGLTSPTQSPITVKFSYSGFDEPTKVLHKRQSDTNYGFTTYAYDANANVVAAEQNGLEDPNGVLLKPGRKIDYAYNEIDDPTSKIDRGLSSAAADDVRTTTTYVPSGLPRTETTAGSDGAGGWRTRASTTFSYFANGNLSTATTMNAGGAALESHTLTYENTNGVYQNGHVVRDVFTVAGPDAAAPCRTASCTTTYTYDPRDRLVQERQDRGTAVNTRDYTLDPSGNVVTEIRNGETTSYTYSGDQLTSLTRGTDVRKYFHDDSGDLDCVTTGAGTRADCNPAEGAAVSPNLVTDYTYDYLDRLAGSRSYTAGATTASAAYEHDALGRIANQAETHGGAARTTAFDYVDISRDVTSEQHKDGSGAMTRTKEYGYDAFGRRTTMTSSTGGTETKYAHRYDPAGSVSMLVGEDGAAAATYGYGPYGESEQDLTKGDVSPDDPINAYRYTGKRLDTGSGTLDMGARRYATDTHRFLQSDQFNDPADDFSLTLDPLAQNRYALAAGNPVGYSELDGHRVVTRSGGYWRDFNRVVRGHWWRKSAAARSRMLQEALMPPFLSHNARHETAVMLTKLAARFRYPGARVTTTRRANAIAGASACGNTGYADVIARWHRVRYVWEIKPDSRYGHRCGPPQLQRYLDALRRQGRSAQRGGWLPPRAGLAPTTSEVVTVRSGVFYEAGVEFYRHFPVVPPGEPVPVEEPRFRWSWNPVTVASTAVATFGVAGTIWWAGKALSPLCGPAAPACVVVL